MKRHEALKDFFRYTVPGRLLKILVTLLVIAYLTQYLLIMAERGRNGLPAKPIEALGEAVTNSVDYLVHHPQTYYWHKDNVPAGQLVADTAVTSAGLLLFSLGRGDYGSRARRPRPSRRDSRPSWKGHWASP